MNYIVLDLEWNQSPYGKPCEHKEIPFEIIEIGAVRFHSRPDQPDIFHETIQPQLYTTLHFKTKEIIRLDQKDLQNARSFPEVFHDFMEWCGKDPIFCTWGPADLTELQRNIAFHRIESPFSFPLFYYDLQKIFSIQYEDRKTRRSLEHAVSYFNIPVRQAFHSALSDALYTREVMDQLSMDCIQANFSVDYFRTPASRKEEIYLQYETYSKFVSRPFDSKISALKDRVVSSTTCYKCHRNVPKKVRWFSSGSSNYLCLSYCSKHGYMKGKIRLRQHLDGAFYAVKTQKFISDEEMLSIREKKEIQAVKRRLRKRYQKTGANP